VCSGQPSLDCSKSERTRQSCIGLPVKSLSARASFTLCHEKKAASFGKTGVEGIERVIINKPSEGEPANLGHQKKNGAKRARTDEDTGI